MIRRSLEIVGSSFKMAMQELWKNKLRTFLSLFGITIGIFCIIGVLATVNSLEQNIQNEVRSLGTNTIYVDKWEYTGGGPDYPWWKYVNRPQPKYEEIEHIKERTSSAKYVAFAINRQDNLEYSGNVLSNVKMYGVSKDYSEIQAVQINWGRYFSSSEFDRGSDILVIGNDAAEKLFGEAERAIGKEVTVKGKKALITGVIKKQGKQMIGGWDFDQSIILPYRFARTIMDERRSDPVIMVQGKDNLSSKALKDELTGTMRALHKLSPTKEEDFALNDINDFSEVISSAFSGLNIGGWAIAALSLIVGMFGVANIMFVSVRERISQIGLKKALGAKRRVILAEFLLESAFLCIVGGLIGLSLVFILTQILTYALNFPVFISTGYMILAIVICIITGILAGFIPALQAAKMDPVVAIRSK
ncbi:MAG TPA: ABC transporter permease [Chitinophagaceae bacterium]|nr:ABC transporter permease [Chitinophagaceae bacterium]HRX92726.1 ABC transporter permease [Chitinophagaceae bacterium]